MPKVGGKKFSYSKKGKAAAKAYAKRTGKKLTKSSSKKNPKPTNVTIPKMAIAVPIQKLTVGLFFKKKNAPTPTHTGERLVSKVACVAVDSWIAMFQTATSPAKIAPQRTVSKKIFKD